MADNKTVFYTPKDGEPKELQMLAVDANEACRNHPNEYSFSPPKSAKVAKPNAPDALKDDKAEAKPKS